MTAALVLAGLALADIGRAHHLNGPRWWDGLTMQQRLDGQLHLRTEAKAALRTLAGHELAARRPHLTRPAQREAQRLLAVLRREIPETREALAAQEAAEAAVKAQLATPSSSFTPPSSPAPTDSIDWLAIADCESGQDWGYSGPGYYDGGLQFDPGTWISAGGGQYAPYAYLATPEQQIATAQRWVSMVGCYWCRAGWPTCGAHG